VLLQGKELPPNIPCRTGGPSHRCLCMLPPRWGVAPHSCTQTLRGWHSCSQTITAYSPSQSGACAGGAQGADLDADGTGSLQYAVSSRVRRRLCTRIQAIICGLH